MFHHVSLSSLRMRVKNEEPQKKVCCRPGDEMRGLDQKEHQESERSSSVLFPWLEWFVFSLECLLKLERVWDKAMNGVRKDSRGRSM